jgi:hypothetical protein
MVISFLLSKTVTLIEHYHHETTRGIQPTNQDILDEITDTKNYQIRVLRLPYTY